jgi:2'-5' RNA ligase
LVASARARVFFALWPDAPLRAALSAAADAAQAECGGRATAAQKIHLTLFFVGAVDRSRLSRLEACAASLTARCFTLDMSTLGYWRHNRIVWAGTHACPAELPRVVSSLSANLAGEGIEGENRPYVPHVTLVRNARRAPARQVIEAPAWEAKELVLVESVPAQRGTRYEVIARFAFSG